jgi:hypothetical protein
MDTGPSDRRGRESWRSEGGQTDSGRRSVGGRLTLAAAPQAPPVPVSGPQTGRKPRRADRHPLRAPDWNTLGIPAPGNGLRGGHDLLAPVARLAGRGGLGPRDRPAHRPAFWRTREWLGPFPLGGGTHHELAAPIPPIVGPLRAAGGRPRSLPGPGSYVDLPQPPHKVIAFSIRLTVGKPTGTNGPDLRCGPASVSRH